MDSRFGIIESGDGEGSPARMRAIMPSRTTASSALASTFGRSSPTAVSATSVCQVCFPAPTKPGTGPPPLRHICYERLRSCSAPLQAIFHLFRVCGEKAANLRKLRKILTLTRKRNSPKFAFHPVFPTTTGNEGDGRPVWRDCVRHQEVAANRPGFPAPTIPRLFSALAPKVMVCRVYSAGTTGLGRRTRKMKSPTPGFWVPDCAGWTDQRDRETFGLAISIRRPSCKSLTPQFTPPLMLAVASNPIPRMPAYGVI